MVLRLDRLVGGSLWTKAEIGKDEFSCATHSESETIQSSFAKKYSDCRVREYELHFFFENPNSN